MQSFPRLVHSEIRVEKMLTLQSLENFDHFVSGKLYSYLGDSYMGLAGQDDPMSSKGARKRVFHVSHAETYIDRARECKLCRGKP